MKNLQRFLPFVLVLGYLLTACDPKDPQPAGDLSPTFAWILNTTIAQDTLNPLRHEITLSDPTFQHDPAQCDEYNPRMDNISRVVALESTPPMPHGAIVDCYLNANLFYSDTLDTTCLVHKYYGMEVPRNWNAGDKLFVEVRNAGTGFVHTVAGQGLIVISNVDAGENGDPGLIPVKVEAQNSKGVLSFGGTTP